MSGDGPVVFDTNTIISAFLFDRSVPNQAFCSVKSDRLLLSAETFGELEEVLRRPKFDRYVELGVRESFLELLAAQCRFIVPTEVINACRDPRDDKFLALAVDGDAACIVSGDRDLLALHPFRGIAIVTAADFLTAIEPSSRAADETTS